MALNLKPLKEQVIVITGASSGIGLATAHAAAKEGANLVLAARSGRALRDIAQALPTRRAIAVECDVADRAQVERIVSAALGEFGRIDTWVNNAGQGLYGRLDEVSEEDSRRLFDINFWGVVNGSLAALPHLKKNGGALINVGSEVSEAYVPLLGMYTASKHAVKGFTDTLRVEVEDVDQAPVSITLIQPTAVDTPFPEHARNYQRFEAKLPSSKVDPEQVAQAILSAATKPARQVKVGLNASINAMMANLVPNIADGMVAKLADQQHTEESVRNPAGTLNQAAELVGLAGRTHGLSGA